MTPAQGTAKGRGYAPSWLVLLGLLLLGFPLAGSAADTSLAAAINKAGLQRMLSQRVLRSYCQVGLGLMPEQSQVQLDSAVALFERQLSELKSVASTSQVQEALAEVTRIWQPFREVAQAPISRAGAARLLYLNDDLLHAAHKVVQLLQDLSGSSTARLVNIAGRQRMLSQRLVKFYMLQEWGFDTPTIQDEFEIAQNAFADALSRLMAAPENTPAIRKELDEAELQWTWFGAALSLRGEASYRLVVADTGERLLAHMHRVTKLYEERSAP